MYLMMVSSPKLGLLSKNRIFKKVSGLTFRLSALENVIVCLSNAVQTSNPLFLTLLNKFSLFISRLYCTYSTHLRYIIGNIKKRIGYSFLFRVAWVKRTRVENKTEMSFTSEKAGSRSCPLLCFLGEKSSFWLKVRKFQKQFFLH